MLYNVYPMANSQQTVLPRYYLEELCCYEGFQPGTINMSVCADNGQWDPNPILHTCTGN